MLREGEKEGKERVQREEASRRKEMLRRLLMKKKITLESKVDEKDELTNQELMNSEHIIIEGTPDITDLPNYASISQFGGDVNIMEGKTMGAWWEWCCMMT